MQADQRANSASNDTQSITNITDEIIDGTNADAVIGVDNTNNAAIADNNTDNATISDSNTDNATTGNNETATWPHVYRMGPSSSFFENFMKKLDSGWRSENKYLVFHTCP